MDEQDDDATYLLIDVTGDVAESDLQPGAKLHIKNLDSGEPIIQLQDGLPRPAEYRDSLGTQLVFLKSEDNIYTLTHKTDIVLKAAAPTHYAQFLAATVPAKAAQPAAVPAAEAAAAPSTAAEASSIVAPAAAESPQADAAAQTAAATPASVVPSTAATEIDSSVAASPAGASAAQLQLEANQGAAPSAKGQLSPLE